MKKQIIGAICREHLRLSKEDTSVHTCKYCKHFIWSAFFCDEGKCWKRSDEGDFKSWDGGDCKHYEFGEPGKFVEVDNKKE